MIEEDEPVPGDDHRGMARKAGYEVETGAREWWVCYHGPDASRRALRDIGPYDNEANAWARAVGLAMTCRDAQA